MDTWGDGGTGLGFVLATNRHKRQVDPVDAVEALATDAVGYFGHHEDESVHRRCIDKVAAHIQTSERPFYWHSVTQGEIDDDSHYCGSDDGCEPGRWCSEGSGKAWVRVLTIDLSTVEALIDEETS